MAQGASDFSRITLYEDVDVAIVQPRSATKDGVYTRERV